MESMNGEINIKRKPGRPRKNPPKVSPGRLAIQEYAKNIPLVLPKTDHQRLRELKELMIRSGGTNVAEKVIQIALNDDHPSQMMALKMCLDRTLPVSMFEKEKGQRSAVTINITGLGEAPTIIEANNDSDNNNNIMDNNNDGDITDV